MSAKTYFIEKEVSGDDIIYYNEDTYNMCEEMELIPSVIDEPWDDDEEDDDDPSELGGLYPRAEITFYKDGRCDVWVVYMGHEYFTEIEGDDIKQLKDACEKYCEE